MTKPLVSVVSCCLNQGDWVRKTVPKMRESLADWPYEIILVDDQSIDGCCHGLPKDVLIVRTEARHGVSASRRLGVSKAQGEILLFSDPHCDYPDHALRDLVEVAWNKQAICLPKTVSLPTEKKPRWGGKLDLCDRGLKISHAHEGPAEYPATVGAIYAVRRDVYDCLGGWPELPGVWGYSEQALSLTAWFAGVPIWIDERHICNHQNYHPNGRFAYRVPMQDQANNGHWVHAAFFPGTYDYFWAPILKKRFRDKPNYWDCLGNRGWESKTHPRRRTITDYRNEILGRSVRTEEDFFRMVLKIDIPMPPTEEWYLDQQRKRSKPSDQYDSVNRRQDRALRWLKSSVPGCLKGRKVLDVGSRTGYGVRKIKETYGALVEGIELVPEVAEYARNVNQLPVKAGDARRLPYRDAEWHVVTCIHTLEHVPEPEKAIQEMLRVLIPGGWLFIAVPVEDAPSKRYAHNVCFKDEQALLDMIGKYPVDNIKSAVRGLSPKPNQEILLVCRKSR